MKKTLSFVMSVIFIVLLLNTPASAISSRKIEEIADNSVGKTSKELNLPSSNWCVYFVGYCINNSSIWSLAGEKISLVDSRNSMTLINWACAKKKIGTYYSLSSTHYDRLEKNYANLSLVSITDNSFTPATGDIIVFDWSGREDVDRIFSHAGIVTNYNAKLKTVTYVDGNSKTGNYTTVVKKSTGTTSNSIIGYIRFNESTSGTSNSDMNITTDFFPCNTIISCFNGQTVNLYSNPGDSSRVTYFSKGQTARSTRGATLSDGSIWYSVTVNHNGSDRLLWLKYDGNKMTYKDIVNGTSDNGTQNIEPARYSVILDNGSSCRQITVTNGSTYGYLGTPTRDGYIFDGWYTRESGGSKITSSTTVNLTSDHTLYAHWTKVAHTEHVKGAYIVDPNHPHYIFYTCPVCGEVFTDDTITTIDSCEICNPKEPIDTGHWGNWSSWSTNSVSTSSTREVETRTAKVSDGYTEYRYGGYVTYDGKHDCWCETYLRNKFGSATLHYSDWSTTRYSPNGKGWTCGSCGGNHIGVSHYGSNGRAWWSEYVLPDDSYYWEESRTVDAQYETQYRYRDWISG